MSRYLFRQVLLLTLGAVSIPSALLCQTHADSLKDLFPLAVGNQWVYQYGRSIDKGPGQVIQYQVDSGTVSFRIISSISHDDSISWVFVGVATIWTKYDQGNYFGPSVWEDTTTLVEFLSGNHNLIRRLPPSTIGSTALPLWPGLADTSRVYRYAFVDSLDQCYVDGIDTCVMRYLRLVFRAGVGLTEAFQSTMITGWPNSSTHSKLRSSIIVGVETSASEGNPRAYRLKQNFPNPFNATTTIPFEMLKEGHVRVVVFDALGRTVSVIASETFRPGAYVRRWQSGAAPSGVYFYRLETDNITETKPMILVK